MLDQLGARSATGEDMRVIRFSLVAIPVTIRPTFWLVALFLGWGVGDQALLAAWVAIVFVSVLAHELGHALLARRFGAEVSITLTTFGGYTRWSLESGGTMSPGRRALVAGAGSAVGIVLGLAVLGLFVATRPWGPTAATITTLIVWVNVGWGVLNWLPIRPLDGGHLTLAILDLVAPKRAERIASVLFVVTSLAALGAALYFDLTFAAILAGFMAWAEISRHFGNRTGGGPVEFSYDDPETESASPEESAGPGEARPRLD